MKDITINIALKQAAGKQSGPKQGANDIGSTFGVPIMFANAPLPLWGIAVRQKDLI